MPKDYFIKKATDLQHEIEKLKNLNKQLEEKLQQQQTGRLFSNVREEDPKVFFFRF